MEEKKEKKEKKVTAKPRTKKSATTKTSKKIEEAPVKEEKHTIGISKTAGSDFDLDKKVHLPKTSATDYKVVKPVPVQAVPVKTGFWKKLWQILKRIFHCK